MKFELGDKVTIREDLEFGEDYYGCCVEKEMLKYRGEEATITLSNGQFYDIDLDDGRYAWTKEMFEPIKTLEQIKIEKLEKRIEKLEKCVMGEQNSLEKRESVSNFEKMTPKLGIKDFKDMIRPNKIVLNTNDPLEMIWNSTDEEEPKPSLLTEDERVILRNLDKKWKWIARDEYGCLCVYDKIPQKGKYELWLVTNDYERMNVFTKGIFQFIKWADKEPYNIEELLKGESDEK